MSRRIDPNSSAFEAYDHLRDCCAMARGVAGEIQTLLGAAENGLSANGEQLEVLASQVRPLLDRLGVVESILRVGVLKVRDGERVPTEDEARGAEVPS